MMTLLHGISHGFDPTNLCAQGLLKNLMELRRCTFGDAYEWVDEQERKQMPIWQLYDALQYLCAPQILVDKTPHNADQYPRQD